jgi:general stress protein YciG
MANRAGNDERGFGASDRERERDVISEPGRNGNGSISAASLGNGTSNGRKSARGFASMDQSKQKEIASKGGRAAHAKGTAHEFDSGEARAAGRKGGMAVSRNREHMAAIGRRGGEARGQRAREASQPGAVLRSAPDAVRQNTSGWARRRTRVVPKMRWGASVASRRSQQGEWREPGATIERRA